MRNLSRQLAEQSMLLDGSQYDTFVIDCKTSVQTLRVRNISPGKLYVFVIVQDTAGNHTLQWGNLMRNAMSVDPDPSSITVQCFVGLTGGVRQAVPPGTWIRVGEAQQGPPGPPGPPGPVGPAGPQGVAGPPAQIIQVADEATAITESTADPTNFYFWV